MKAIRMHEYGGPDVLHFEDVPRPEPREGEVLIRVHAAGVNPIDWKIRAGTLRQKVALTLPAILGADYSGIVQQLGPDVTGLRIGSEVFGRADGSRCGTYAEFVAVRADTVVSKPRSLDHVRAAAVPLAALTAWQALYRDLRLVAGQSLLVHGAAGGVGIFAVQLAKWTGATVIGTASARNRAFLHELGADEVIDYTTQRFETLVREVDAVLDNVGGETQARSWAVLKTDGVLASVVGMPDAEDARRYGVRAVGVQGRHSGARELAQIAELIDRNIITPVIGQVFPLAEARRAHELSQSGHARGKIVLRVVG